MTQQPLTPMEKKIYKAVMLKQCYTPREISKKLRLKTTRQSVSLQLNSVIRKLGYKNVTELVLQESKNASSR